MELFSLLAKLTLDKSEYDKSLDEAQHDADAFEMPETPSLELETDGFSDGIKEAQDNSTSFGTIVGQVFDGIKDALLATGVVAAVSSLVGFLREGVNLAVQMGDDVDKGSKRLNISTKAYQEWQHALSQSGSNINDLNRGIRTMNKLLIADDPGAVLKNAADAADGLADTVSKDAAQAFSRLGLSEKVANKEIKTTEELMEATLISLAGFKGTKEERGTLVTALFGPNGNNLNALLDEGVDGVKELLDEANKLGLVMSDEEIQSAVKYGDDLTNLHAELDAVKTAFAKDILPVLDGAVVWLTDFLSKLNPRLRTNSINVIFNDIDNRTKQASKDIDSATITAKALIEDLQSMGDYWTLDEQGRMTWDALAAKALELFPQLSTYIDNDGKKISGNTDEIERNIDAWARLEKQRLLSNAMGEKSQAIADQLTSAYDKAAEAEIKADEALAHRKQALNDINAALKAEGMDQLGLDASAQQMRDAVQQLRLLYADDQNNTAKFLQYNALGSDYLTAEGQAESMRIEAEKMIAEAEEAQSKLAEYEQKLSEQMGLTKEDVIKTKDEVEKYRESLDSIPSDVWTTLHLDEDRSYGRAIGDRYIPYDNFPALLHRGERVLTATEARREDRGSISADFENRVIAAIREGMAGAQVEAIVTDREIAKGTNRYNGKEIDSGRFLP